jgi:hypothetical protein
MGALGAPQVLLGSEQEGMVGGELDHLTLRLLAEVAVVGDLLEEGGKTAIPRQRRHPQDDAASVGVLRIASNASMSSSR